MPVIDSFTGDYRFLSNFAEIPVLWTGAPTIHGYQVMEFRTSEHAFHAAKCVSPDALEWVTSAPTASEAKQRGRGVKIRDDWEQIKRVVMLEIQLAKFGKNNPALGARLAATQGYQLIEGNRWGDDYWGCVPAEARRQVVMPLWGPERQWAGENWLGVTLMMVREVLR